MKFENIKKEDFRVILIDEDPYHVLLDGRFTIEELQVIIAEMVKQTGAE